MSEPGNLVITRIFRAPRELVYAAFTDASHLERWFGPAGFTILDCVSEPRPGGAMSLTMRHDADDGALYPMTATYGETYPPERFELYSQAIGPDGSVAVELRTVYTFVERGASTEVTLDIQVIRMTDIGEQYREGMDEGWAQSLDKLAKYLEERTANVNERAYPSS